MNYRKTQEFDREDSTYRISIYYSFHLCFYFSSQKATYEEKIKVGLAKDYIVMRIHFFVSVKKAGKLNAK